MGLGVRPRDRENAAAAAELVCVAIVTLIPLAFLPSGFFIFLPIKWALGLALTVAGLALVIARGRFRLRTLTPWGAFLVVAAVATAASVDRVTSFIGSPTRNMGLITWALFAAAFSLGASASPRERRSILIAACGASMLVSVYGVLQAIGVDFIDWQSRLDVTRSRSTFGNAAFLGGYLVLVIPLAVRLAFEEAKRATRFMLGAAAVLASACLLTTRTRGAWVGAAVAIAIVVMLERKALKRNAKIAITIACLAAIAIVVTVAPFRARVASIADISQGTARGRIIQWHLTTELISARPLFGWGPDTLRTEFPDVIDDRFEREVGRDVVPDRAHNVYLDIAAGFGIIGVLAYLFLQVSVLRRVIRERTPVTVAIFGGLVGYIVQSLFSFPVADVDLIFWLFAGLGVCLGFGPKERTAAKGAARRERRDRKTTHLVAAWALGVLALAVLVWSGREVRADLLLGRGLRLQDSNPLAAAALIDRSARLVPERVQYSQASARFRTRLGGARRSDSDFEKALATLGGALRRYSRDGELRLDRADLFLVWGEMNGDAGMTARAERAYRELLRNDRSSSRVYLKLGVALVEQQRFVEAETAWRRAAFLAPRHATPHVNLGLLYETIGRVDDARDEFEKALRIEPNNSGADEGLRRLNQ
ncbi:MAG TPA: O-antigen ligase family protein [Actinomycetota bacterium]|nr:O-antigen ligase family protein [Actinomycetota bacterium]